jgi:hypothetical protein
MKAKSPATSKRKTNPIVSKKSNIDPIVERKDPILTHDESDIYHLSESQLTSSFYKNLNSVTKQYEERESLQKQYDHLLGVFAISLTAEGTIISLIYSDFSNHSSFFQNLVIMSTWFAILLCAVAFLIYNACSFIQKTKSPESKKILNEKPSIDALIKSVIDDLRKERKKCRLMIRKQSFQVREFSDTLSDETMEIDIE